MSGFLSDVTTAAETAVETATLKAVSEAASHNLMEKTPVSLLDNLTRTHMSMTMEMMMLTSK